LFGFNRHYLIKIDALQFELPDICPVCSEAADSQGEIVAISQHDRRRMTGVSSTSMAYGRSAFGRRRPGERTAPAIRRYAIPTCKKHAYSPSKSSRRRGILGFVGGVATMLTLVVGSIIAFNFYDGNIIPLNWYILFIFAVALMTGSFVALGPNPLDRAISVYEIMPSAGVVILKIKNKEYRDEILRLNPMKSQPARKIRTSTF
jgi:hypothetical protein